MVKINIPKNNIDKKRKYIQESLSKGPKKFDIKSAIIYNR
jgi:hypothetical protein